MSHESLTDEALRDCRRAELMRANEIASHKTARPVLQQSLLASGVPREQASALLRAANAEGVEDFAYTSSNLLGSYEHRAAAPLQHARPGAAYDPDAASIFAARAAACRPPAEPTGEAST